jgi:Tfp pilus assembly protein PilO
MTLPLAAIAVGFVALAFVPEQRRTQALRDEMHLKQDFILAAGKTGVRLHELHDELAETRRYNAHWHGGERGSAQITALYGQIAQLAQIAGITTTRFAPGAPKEIEQLRRIPLDVVCHGSFAQIQTFLASLEACQQPVWLDDLKLEANSEYGGSVRCELALAAFIDNSEKSD